MVECVDPKVLLHALGIGKLQTFKITAAQKGRKSDQLQSRKALGHSKSRDGDIQRSLLIEMAIYLISYVELLMAHCCGANIQPQLQPLEIEPTLSNLVKLMTCILL